MSIDNDSRLKLRNLNSGKPVLANSNLNQERVYLGYLTENSISSASSSRSQSNSVNNIDLPETALESYDVKKPQKNNKAQKTGKGWRSYIVSVTVCVIVIMLPVIPTFIALGFPALAFAIPGFGFAIPGFGIIGSVNVTFPVISVALEGVQTFCIALAASVLLGGGGGFWVAYRTRPSSHDNSDIELKGLTPEEAEAKVKAGFDLLKKIFEDVGDKGKVNSKACLKQLHTIFHNENFLTEHSIEHGNNKISCLKTGDNTEIFSARRDGEEYTVFAKGGKLKELKRKYTYEGKKCEGSLSKGLFGWTCNIISTPNLGKNEEYEVSHPSGKVLLDVENKSQGREDKRKNNLSMEAVDAASDVLPEVDSSGTVKEIEPVVEPQLTNEEKGFRLLKEAYEKAEQGEYPEELLEEFKRLSENFKEVQGEDEYDATYLRGRGLYYATAPAPDRTFYSIADKSILRKNDQAVEFKSHKDKNVIVFNKETKEFKEFKLQNEEISNRNSIVNEEEDSFDLFSKNSFPHEESEYPESMKEVSVQKLPKEEIENKIDEVAKLLFSSLENAFNAAKEGKNPVNFLKDFDEIIRSNEEFCYRNNGTGMASFGRPRGVHSAFFPLDRSVCIAQDKEKNISYNIAFRPDKVECTKGPINGSDDKCEVVSYSCGKEANDRCQVDVQTSEPKESSETKSRSAEPSSERVDVNQVTDISVEDTISLEDILIQGHKSLRIGEGYRLLEVAFEKVEKHQNPESVLQEFKRQFEHYNSALGKLNKNNNISYDINHNEHYIKYQEENKKETFKVKSSKGKYKFVRNNITNRVTCSHGEERASWGF